MTSFTKNINLSLFNVFYLENSETVYKLLQNKQIALKQDDGLPCRRKESFTSLLNINVNKLQLLKCDGHAVMQMTFNQKRSQFQTLKRKGLMIMGKLGDDL
jgi:hypothetical protein